MPTLCIQCSLQALLDDKPAPIFDETPEAHMRRLHSDPVAAREQRLELEKQLAEKMKAGVMK